MAGPPGGPGPRDGSADRAGWLAGRFALAGLDPGRAGVRALAAVAALVVALAAFFAWRARPDVEPVPPPVADASALAVPAGPAPGGLAPGGAGSGGAVGATVPATGPMLVVAVAGRVRHPGLVHVPPGARVADVLDAAGGVLPGTDVAFLNLARKVSDGELVVVGVTPPPGAGGGSATDPGAGGAGVVNLNTATMDQLQTLPGVGPVLAQRILDYRQAHGGFRSVSELRQVSGIGDARFAQLKDLVTA